jgi:hypothetical protein
LVEVSETETTEMRTKQSCYKNGNQGNNQMQDNAYGKLFQEMGNITHMRICEVLVPPKGCLADHPEYDNDDIPRACHVKQTTRSVTRNNRTINGRCKHKRKNGWMLVGKVQNQKP